MSDKPGSAAPASPEGESSGHSDAGKRGASRMMIGVVLIAAIAFFLFLLNQVQPAKEAQGLPAPAVVSYASPGDHARAEIAGLLERDRSSIDQDGIYRRAEQFRADGAMADAYILYFFAARQGHGPSAFRLGTMADPEYHDAYRDVLPEPDLFQALKWYRQASAAGVGEANAPLQRLVALIRQRAADGDDEARRLLLEVE